MLQYRQLTNTYFLPIFSMRLVLLGLVLILLGFLTGVFSEPFFQVIQTTN